MATVVLPDRPSEVLGFDGSVDRFILRDWLLFAKDSFRTLPNAERLTEANRFESPPGENVLVFVSSAEVLD